MEEHNEIPQRARNISYEKYLFCSIIVFLTIWSIKRAKLRQKDNSGVLLNIYRIAFYNLANTLQLSNFRMDYNTLIHIKASEQGQHESFKGLELQFVSCSEAFCIQKASLFFRYFCKQISNSIELKHHNTWGARRGVRLSI